MAMTPPVVVVTGVSRYIAAHVAARLAADPAIGRVIGLDATDPPADLAPLLEEVELIGADLRTAGPAWSWSTASAATSVPTPPPGSPSIPASGG